MKTDTKILLTRWAIFLSVLTVTLVLFNGFYFKFTKTIDYLYMAIVSALIISSFVTGLCLANIKKPLSPIAYFYEQEAGTLRLLAREAISIAVLKDMKLADKDKGMEKQIDNLYQHIYNDIKDSMDKQTTLIKESKK